MSFMVNQLRSAFHLGPGWRPIVAAFARMGVIAVLLQHHLARFPLLLFPYLCFFLLFSLNVLRWHHLRPCLVWTTGQIMHHLFCPPVATCRLMHAGGTRRRRSREWSERLHALRGLGLANKWPGPLIDVRGLGLRGYLGGGRQDLRAMRLCLALMLSLCGRWLRPGLGANNIIQQTGRQVLIPAGLLQRGTVISTATSASLPFYEHPHLPVTTCYTRLRYEEYIGSSGPVVGPGTTSTAYGYGYSYSYRSYRQPQGTRHPHPKHHHLNAAGPGPSPSYCQVRY